MVFSPSPSSTSGAYFISDAHLGLALPGCEKREAMLRDFFRTRVAQASHLFIVGDLFDFWIEYRHAIRPEYFTAVHELKLLSEKGVAVHYLCGNHDFAMGTFLRDTAGIQVHPDGYHTTLQGKKLYLFHGDGLLSKDVGYRILRRILRNRLNQRLYKLLHPNLGIPLAQMVSGSSRHLLSFRMRPSHLMEYRRSAWNELQKGSDIVIFGHTHTPELSFWGEKTYCNTGNWLKNHFYAHMYKGKVSLYEYATDTDPRPVQPNYSPSLK